MPVYEYKAFGPGGALKSGIVNADTERDALAESASEIVEVLKGASEKLESVNSSR